MILIENKQHQRVLWDEIHRLPNETIKQLAFRIETLLRKAYSLKTHDYKNTKMTEFLMMTLTPQLRKIAIKKRASHPSSIREPDLDFRKLVDKLEQAEITMKLEETKKIKSQYVNRFETKTTHNNNIQESDIDLSEKITEILNIYERKTNYEGKPTFKNGVYIAGITDTVFLNVDKNSKIIKINLQSKKSQISHFINTRKKIKIYQTKIYTANLALENHFQATKIVLEINHHITLVKEVDHPNKEVHEISHKIDIVDRIVEKTIHNRIQTQHNLFQHPVCFSIKKYTLFQQPITKFIIQ